MKKISPRRFPWASAVVIFCLAVTYATIVFRAELQIPDVKALWSLPLVGIFGATIANASGTGGGVVFIPVLNAMAANGLISINPTNVLATSFFVQCFGMTMGSLTWLNGIYKRSPPNADISIQAYWKTAISILAIAIPCMVLTQWFIFVDTKLVLIAFKIFSISLGTILVFNTLRSGKKPKQSIRTIIGKKDFAILLLLAPIGGIANAFFSIGLGEIVALFLFLRGYSILTSSGLAVLLSCVSAIIGVQYHILSDNIPWNVVAMTAPGAFIGGFIARSIALKMGIFWLKLAAGCWIVFSGLGLLFLL